jgi:hypothetical protein
MLQAPTGGVISESWSRSLTIEAFGLHPHPLAGIGDTPSWGILLLLKFIFSFQKLIR